MWARTLNSQWYREEILSIVPRNIDGLGRWYSLAIENPKARLAYLEVIEECGRICSSSWDLNRALEQLKALKETHDGVAAIKQDWKVASWLKTDVRLVALVAIDQCIELVSSIKQRYLTN